MAEVRTCLLTGGGTAGHVIPNFPIAESLQKEGWRVVYVGSKAGIENKLVTQKGIPFYSIMTGKLRRYFSLQNFWDAFKVPLGIIQSFFLLGKLKPHVVFSKGGFVGFPITFVAWLRRIPVVLHESDYSPGLANKLSEPFAKVFCVNFDETKTFYKKSETVHVTGLPVRSELFHGDRQKGRELCGIQSNKPTLLIMGGSLGANAINNAVWESLDEILQKFSVIHLTGPEKFNPSLQSKDDYKQFEYANETLPDLLAATDFVLSRSGATTVFEMLALQKPSLFIPLTMAASRGDQILNAKSFAKKGLAHVLFEEDVTGKTLLEALDRLVAEEKYLKESLSKSSQSQALQKIVQLIQENAKSL